MRTFAYRRPLTLSQAFDVLDEYADGASLLAGGTDLVVGLRKGQLNPAAVIDIKRIADLAPGIREASGHLIISALTALRDISFDDRVRRHFPALVEAADTVGSVQIRNRAMLTGNICNASPAADTAPALLAYRAAVSLVSRHGSRLIPVEDFLLGPRSTARRSDEIAVAVEIPIPRERTGSRFARLTRRRGVDLATLSLCCAAGPRVTRFAYGAVGPRPFAMTDESGLLADPHSDPAARAGMLRDFAAHAAPISDLRGSREYRQAMLLTLSERALRTAIERRDGGDHGAR